jgi:DNA-binding transcriptional ArsR family regulator
MSNHKYSGSWDPDNFRLGPVDQAKADIPKGRRISPVRGRFIAGPIDVAWLSEARKIGVTALWVGLSLWFLRGMRQSDNFLVSNLTMQEWGVLPDAKRRALRKLKKAGLITVEQRGKRSPRVSLVMKPLKKVNSDPLPEH